MVGSESDEIWSRILNGQIFVHQCVKWLSGLARYKGRVRLPGADIKFFELFRITFFCNNVLQTFLGILEFSGELSDGENGSGGRRGG